MIIYNVEIKSDCHVPYTIMLGNRQRKRNCNAQ